jgi:tetratricopeptide (TPR) repeat protein
MSRVVGPRKVNPAVEPGQALVIVEGVKSANSHEAKVAAADRALASGTASSALVMYNEIAKSSKRDPHILMGRAVAQQKLGMNDAAIESYNRVLDASPNNVDAMVNMLGLLRQKDPQGALDHMRSLGNRFPDDAGLAAQTGMAEGEAGNYPDAMKYLGKAAALQPENPQHPFNMAVLADRQGDTAAAARYYQLALTQTASEPDSGLSRDAIEKRLAVLAKR